MRSVLPILFLALIAAPSLDLSPVEAAAVPSPMAVGNASVTIRVTNIRNARGRVHIDLCRQSEFLKNCPISAEAPAMVGTTVVTIGNVPPGIYAAQAFQDENSNGRVDRALFGIPKEGVGFSNDAPINFGPPKWKDAMFGLQSDTAITLKMRYFGGVARG